MNHREADIATEKLIHIHELHLNSIVHEDASGQLSIVDRLAICRLKTIHLFGHVAELFGKKPDDLKVEKVNAVNSVKKRVDQPRGVHDV